MLASFSFDSVASICPRLNESVFLTALWTKVAFAGVALATNELFKVVGGGGQGQMVEMAMTGLTW